MSARKSGEKLSQFIGRFLSSKREEKQSPEIKHRLSLGYSEAREQSKKERKRS